MSRMTKSVFSFTLAGAVIGFAGCRKDPNAAAPPAAETDSSAKPPAADMPAADQPANEPAAGDQSQAAEIEAAFASLTPGDRALAIEQKICPVGGGPLGTMGTPIKVAVAGQQVFICCEHCQEPLLADPATHLAKIGKQPAAESPAQ